MSYFYEFRVAQNGDKKGIELIDNTTEHLIYNVDIEFDTIDNNVHTKSSAMITRVHIKGSIPEEGTANGELQKLFDWAKDFSGTTYRDVEVVVKKNIEEELKRFSFGQMFVRDYKESYKNERDSTNGEFELFLSQREMKFETAEVFLS